MAFNAHSVEKAPFCVFNVTGYGHHIRVRLYCAVGSVHRDYKITRNAGRAAKQRGMVVAYFSGMPYGKYLRGSITLAACTNLYELVPHEVTHAVEYLFGTAPECEERRAITVGIFCREIFAVGAGLQRSHDFISCFD